MKKFIITIIATLLTGFVAIQAEELTSTVTIDGKAVSASYLKLSNNTVALGNGHNSCVKQYVKGFLTIPGQIQVNGTTYTVTEVSNLAFRLCSGITGVEIEEGVTRVGAFAFNGCPYISEIILPASLQSIGSGAFLGCINSLKEVTCKGTTPPTWEYNDVFVFHQNGIGDNMAGVITAATKLYVPDGTTEVYRAALYTNPTIGWTTADGWGSFSYVHLGQATFHIDSPFDLQVLREIVNVGHMYGQIGRVVLDSDIDMSDYEWDCGMGVSEEEAFEGSFYGNHHTISNLKIDTDNYGGFFAHYGGHVFRDVTFKDCTFDCSRADRTLHPDGVMGCVVGECGALDMFNVCLDNCEIISNFTTNGFLMGRCLTSGAANFYNCVVKDCRYLFDIAPSYNGGLVGECHGGSATDCALYNNGYRTMSGWRPYPFVAKCLGTNETFNVKRCYNTDQFFGVDPDTELPYRSNVYQPASNVIYSQVVLEKERSINYIKTDGTQGTVDYTMSIWEPTKGAYFKTLFMIPELGLDNWIYQEGEFPVPAAMQQLMPEPTVNIASFIPRWMQEENPRVNGLSPDEYIPNDAWYDTYDGSGFRSFNFIASRLWIDDDFNTTKPSSSSLSVHNPKLPIGSARIVATNGIEYDRVLDVTPNGTEAYTLPNAVLDSQGNPQMDENGNYITDGETTLYEYDVYKATDYTLYLPYSLTVNGGAELYQPVGVRHDGDKVIVKMDIVDDGIIKPWFPYYVVVNDAPIKLGVNHQIVLEQKDMGILYETFENDNYRMYGTPGKFNPGNNIYQLQEDDTWRIDNSAMLPFTCYLTNESGTTVDHFSSAIELEFHETSDNENLIATYNGCVVDAVLYGRIFYKDDTWYTLCLPFDLDRFDGTPLEDATVRKLYSSEFDADHGELKINFALTNSIEAGRPYLVKWSPAPRVISPTFENVTIDDTDAIVDKKGPVSFVATYSPVMLPADSDRLLYVGDDNQLFYPETDVEINAFRGFFLLSGELANNASHIRRVVVNYDSPIPTAIENVNTDQPVDNRWYTIDGRVLLNKPTVAGIYIHAGKKVLIK